MMGAMRGWHGMRMAMGEGWAGESSRCEDPAPTVGMGGDSVATHAAPTIICDHVGINGNGEWEDHDAARRVATSSEKRENRF